VLSKARVSLRSLFVLGDLIRPFQRLFSRQPDLTRDERLFRDYVVSGLEPVLLRQLLDAGRWDHAEAGTVFIRQGETVTHMIFVAAGEVEITVDGKIVGYCDIGSLVGEIGVLTDAPATATAIAKSPVRYLAFERGKLLPLIDREPHIGRALDRTVRQGLRQKLASTNEALVRAEDRAAEK
jgi:CRP-like cAMP-binding protein